MKTEITNENALNVAIGQKIAEILDLKVGKRGNMKGRIATTWGTKSIQGLGAVITRIVEEEKERLQS